MANSSGHMSHHGAHGTEWTLVAPNELARLASLQRVPTRHLQRVQEWTLVAPNELARLASLQRVPTRHLQRVQGGRPPTVLVCQSGGVEHHSREASMGQVSTIGLDLAKSVFQVHGADASGAVVVRKRLRRSQVRPFLAAQPPCTVTMEACGSAHYWAGEIGLLGHAVRLIPPA